MTAQVLTIAGLILSVLSIVVGYLYFRAQRVRRSLIYEVVSDSPLITTSEDLGGQLEVRFNGTAVDNAHLIILRLANSGNAPITEPDYSSPIRVTPSGGEGC